ncbi:MAG: 3-phosphoshikimate 1-carboxyvinyltransferase [Candidatus Ancillula sp.]|jgi:3-phosphoshikimate 1-carboxyvinyltransferase|nr:3-phosphoshikimate 1-carboxyvinyltransferase [Candidatus Ancillula sp.]
MDKSLWEAPYLGENREIFATVEVPASKSLSNRYLILQALSKMDGNECILSNMLKSRDSKLMQNAVSKILSIKEGMKTEIDCGLAGTVMRFAPVLAATVLPEDSKIRFDGDKEAYKRPVGPVLNALESLGFRVEQENGDFLPFTIFGFDKENQFTKNKAKDVIEIDIDSSASSQFISALLLCSPKLAQKIGVSKLVIKHIGNKLPSLPHIEMTVQVLQESGVQIDANYLNFTFEVKSGKVKLPDTIIEPDLSNAGPFICAALANSSGGEVRIPNWTNKTTQPGKYFPQILEKLGAKTKIEKRVLSVKSNGVINGLGINNPLDLSKAGEITPTVCALLALSPKPSVVKGVGHLRLHETDRLAALVKEINRIGRDAKIGDDNDSLEIGEYPESGLHSAIIETYKDHRMATFGAILGLRIPGIEVENIATTAKTMPDFPNMWQKMVLG